MSAAGAESVAGSWRGTANHLFSLLDRPIEKRLFNYFKAFLALKLYLGPVLNLGPNRDAPTLAGIFDVASSGSGLILLLALVITIGSPNHYKFGLWIFLVRKFSFVASSLPMTPNHGGLELLLLVILLLFPATPTDEPPAEGRVPMVDGRACRLILFTIVSVYFWAGIQKLFHGYFLNGEAFTVLLFAAEGEATSGIFRALFLSAAGLVGQAPLPQFSQPNWLVPQTFEYPIWVIYFLIAQSWIAVSGELVVPFLLLFKRTRAAAKFLFLPLALGIALVSGETDFAMTNFVCLLLFFPRQANWAYPAATLAVLIVHFTRIFGDFGA